MKAGEAPTLVSMPARLVGHHPRPHRQRRHARSSAAERQDQRGLLLRRRAPAQPDRRVQHRPARRPLHGDRHVRDRGPDRRRRRHRGLLRGGRSRTRRAAWTSRPAARRSTARRPWRGCGCATPTRKGDLGRIERQQAVRGADDRRDRSAGRPCSTRSGSWTSSTPSSTRWSSTWRPASIDLGAVRPRHGSPGRRERRGDDGAHRATPTTGRTASGWSSGITAESEELFASMGGRRRRPAG